MTTPSGTPLADCVQHHSRDPWIGALPEDIRRSGTGITSEITTRPTVVHKEKTLTLDIKSPTTPYIHPGIQFTLRGHSRHCRTANERLPQRPPPRRNTDMGQDTWGARAYQRIATFPSEPQSNEYGRLTIRSQVDEHLPWRPPPWRNNDLGQDTWEA
ncbi:hypothetical protein COLO4_35330 [Corchorus olitorius]|uniref:Uncharacterized protein n=1 Tax=Corchorus olitorius TaxID=93759 RepID=A0A1R3GHE7_9ROSI|nr:hypothetical protein COLO4_35330 [Corchorus olitorius]